MALVSNDDLGKEQRSFITLFLVLFIFSAVMLLVNVFVNFCGIQYLSPFEYVRNWFPHSRILVYDENVSQCLTHADGEPSYISL